MRSLVKSKSRLFFGFVTGLVTIGLIFSCYGYWLTLPVSRATTLQSFEVAKGESVKTIAAHLASSHLIRSPLYFRLLIQQRQITLQAGLYQLSSSQTPRDIALTLTKGLAIDQKLVIPEGYRSEQIAQAAGIPTKDFLAAAKGLEGQLFPDTYFVKKDITAPELVAIMHDNFLKKAGVVDKTTLILASLIERETRGDSEKPVVAGILKKRLAAGWPLELDATVQYFLGKSPNWWPDTTLLDRKLPSAYNTYLNKGLPPGPIGNPGLVSINAARNPQDSPYWFYLHDKSGQIHYATTNSEHEQNIAKYIN